MIGNWLHEEQNRSRRDGGDRLKAGQNLPYEYDDRLHEEQNPPQRDEGTNSEAYVSGTNS